MPSNNSPLIVHPNDSSNEYVRVTPEIARWGLLNFAARRLNLGESWQHETGENELALISLGGSCAIRSNRGEWLRFGRRPNVFAGMPYCLYLPRRTQVEVEALTEGVDLAYGWCPTDQDHPAQLIPPSQVAIELRGGGNASRQINSMIPPGFDCHRLIVVEVYTPPGNWSSYPPHKHDIHRVNQEGEVVEADLEEVYFYKIDRPEGYAFQRVYSGDGRLDELVLARPDDVVLIPEGFHPVVSPPGYTSYYLNILAGSAQSLANMDDPQYAWVKKTWTEKDPRVPVVSLTMEV